MPTRPSRLFALVLLTSLAACGGGGDSSSSSTVNVSSKSTAQSVSASGAAMPNDSTEAVGVAVTTAKVAIAGSCLGGGTAMVSVTGGTPTSRLNGVFDAGEAYDIMFTQCKSANGAAAVNGRMTLTVISTSPSLSVDTATTNLSVALPFRTVTLNGSSTLTQTVTGTAGNTTTTNHWVSSGIRVDSQRTAGSSRYELRNVDYTRNIIAVNGTPVSSNCVGHSTLDAQLLFLPWFITIATLDPTFYGPGGVVISGRWSIDLPNDHLELQITPVSVSLKVDLGNNGSTDLSFFFSIVDFFDAAG